MLTCHPTIRHLLVLQKRMFSSSSQFEVLDVKNSHLIYLKDKGASLPFMSQVITDKGQKGVVLKLGEQSTTVIGMYHNIEPSPVINITSTAKSMIPSAFAPQLNNIYDINLESIGGVKDVQPNRMAHNTMQRQGKLTRIQALSPVFTVCQDAFVGNLLNFSGPLGSARTANAFDIMELFTNSNIKDPIAIYLNSNLNDSLSCNKAINKYRCLAFGRKPVPSLMGSGSLSSVGVCMLAVKSIKLAQQLKKQQNNVMLVMDNMHEVLANEWTILQNLKISISPFNILNQLYALSSEGELGKKTIPNEVGSLTTIMISSPETGDVIQEYTTLGNNSKHIKTLCPQVKHPLDLTIRNTKISSSKLKNSMRKKVNKLLQEKRDKEMLIKLKLTKDEPWEHYYILDSEWWVPALKNYQPRSVSDRDLFLWFLNINISEEMCAHWKIGCLDAYNRYLDFLARPEDGTMGMDEAQLQHFIDICKSQDLYDIFKKDYLI